MGVAELEEEFNRIRKLIDDGSKLIERHDYEAAQNVLFQALKHIEAMKFPAKIDKVVCLEKLADAYFAQKKFIEARAVYQQLNSTFADFAEAEELHRARALFKLAAATEKVQDFEVAAEIFEQATKSAESCMQPGEPLLTEIYEAYSSLLRRTRQTPERLKELENKSRFSRQKQSGVQGSLFDPRDVEKKRRMREEETEAFMAMPLSQRILAVARQKPVLALFVLSFPVTIAVIFLAVVAACAMLGVDIGSTTTLEPGQTYSTLDGSIKLQVRSSKQADLISSKVQPISLRSLNRWSELVESMRLKSGQYWLKNEGTQLVADDGSTFYRRDSIVLTTRAAMEDYGKGLQKWVVDKGTVPDVNSMKNYGYLKADKYPDTMFKISHYSGNTVADSLDRRRVAAISNAMFLNEIGQIDPDDDIANVRFTGATPLMVVAFLHKEGCAVMAMDDNKARLKTANGKQWQLYSTPNLKIIPGKFNDEPTIAEIVGKQALLIGERSKHQVAEKYMHVFSALFMLFFFVPVGFMMVKQLQKERPKFDYYAPPDRGVEAIGWMFYSFLCLCYLAYVGWVVLG